MFQDGTYECRSIPLGGVRRLLLFTDGVLEVENQDGEAFQQSGLLKVFSEARGDRIEEVLGDILGSVRSFAAEGRFADDVCLLGLEITG